MGFEWGKEKPGRLGGYFTALINTDQDFHWSLIPFILIWAGFAFLLLVGTPRPRPAIQLNSHTTGLLFCTILRPMATLT